MNRTLPTFSEAAQRVKIGHFANIGGEITGVIHVGTNYGYEIKWYQQMGIEHIIGFEPLHSAQKQAQCIYPDVPIHGIALGNQHKYRHLTVHAGNGQGSTLLHDISPDPNTIILDSVLVAEWRFDEFYAITRNGLGQLVPYFPYNCLVIDVEGYEFPVLEGFGTYLDQIDFLNVELSRKPRYEGQAPAHEVSAWLNCRGFVQLTEICDHNDVLFARPRAYINKLKQGPVGLIDH